MQPAQQQGRFFPSNNSAQVRSMRRCRVIGCFASSTQQMNSFRPSGVKLSHSSKTFGFDRTAASRSSPASWTVPWGKAITTRPRTNRKNADELRRDAPEPVNQTSSSAKAETARRCDELAKRILRMPPQPRKPSPSKLARAAGDEPRRTKDLNAAQRDIGAPTCTRIAHFNSSRGPSSATIRLQPRSGCFQWGLHEAGGPRLELK